MWFTSARKLVSSVAVTPAMYSCWSSVMMASCFCVSLRYEYVNNRQNYISANSFQFPVE
ncbi:hypothetical protein Hanom_Chr01g00081031 [Helianthus anomalus]